MAFLRINNQIHDEETKVTATFNEFSSLYVDSYVKSLTVSEFDREEVPVVYCYVPKLRQNRDGLGLDFTPITFLTCYYFQTHKGL